MTTYQVFNVDTFAILWITHDEGEAISALCQARKTMPNVGLLTIVEGR